MVNASTPERRAARSLAVWALVVALLSPLSPLPQAVPSAEAALAADAQTTPRVPRHSGWGKRIVYDKSRQRVWLVTGDNVAKSTYLVSGHKSGTLPGVGKYRVKSKSRYSSSLDGSVSMEYMVRFVYGNTRWIGFHSIPRDGSGRLIQRLSQLGTPTSSGCIRQALRNARQLYRFAPVGTRVVVIR